MKAMATHRSHSIEFKRQVAQEYLADETLHAERNLTMQRGLGIDTRFLSDAEVADQMPWLNPDNVAGVIWEAEGGFADPVRSTKAYVGAFERLGGTVRLRTACRGLVRQGNESRGW